MRFLLNPINSWRKFVKKETAPRLLLSDFTPSVIISSFYDHTAPGNGSLTLYDQYRMALIGVL